MLPYVVTLVVLIIVSLRKSARISRPSRWVLPISGKKDSKISPLYRSTEAISIKKRKVSPSAFHMLTKKLALCLHARAKQSLQ